MLSRAGRWIAPAYRYGAHAAFLVVVVWAARGAGLVIGGAAVRSASPTCAFSFLFLAVAVWLVHAARTSRLRKGGAATVIVLSAAAAGVVLSSAPGLFSGQPSGFDALFAGGHLGRYAQVTLSGAFAVLALSAGVVCLGAGPRAVVASQVLACLVALASLLGLLGFLYQDGTAAGANLGALVVTGRSPQSLLVSSFLAVCLFLGRPEQGLVRLIRSSGAGGGLIRRRLPYVIVTPVAVGVFALLGQQIGLYEPSFGLAIATVASMAVLLASLLLTGRKLDGFDARLGVADSMFEHMFSASPLGIVLFDRHLKRLRANPAFAKILMLSVEDALTVPLGSFTTSDDFQKGMEALERLRSGASETERFDSRIIRSDGEVRTVVMIFSLLKNAPADGAHLMAVVADVTEKRRAEEDLMKSRERLAFGQKVARMGDFEWDIATNRSTRSEEAMRLYGLDPRDAGQAYPYEDFAARVHPDDRERVGNRIRSVLERGDTSYSLDYRILREETAIHIHVEAVVVRDAAGKPLRIFGTIQDIDERKKMELDLNEKKEQLKLVLETLPIGVWYLDRGGKVVMSNRGGETVLGGLPGRELCCCDFPMWSIDSGERIARERTPMYRALQLGQTVIDEPLRVDCPDGVQRLVSCSAAPIRDVDDATIGAILVFQDITDRTRLERQATRSRSMDSLGMLAGHVAHDFRSVLGLIGGHAELARAALEAREIEEALRLNAQVRRYTHEGSELVGRILGFARGLDVSWRPVDVNFVLRDVTSSLRPSFSGIVFGEKLAEVGNIVADEALLRRVFRNIFQNAREAMEHGGRIDVETSLISSVRMKSSWPDAYPVRHVLISIVDTGAGMDAGTMAKIFDPFFTTREARGGSGLGLSFVYGAVQRHGGIIDVDSAPGRGTRFDLYLPVVPPGDPGLSRP